MAIFYLNSVDGSDASDGSTWADAKATTAGAIAAMSAGDTCYVSDNHAETQAGAMTLTGPATTGDALYFICANDAAEPPTAVATTATVTVSGNAAMNFSGRMVFQGISFFVGTSGGSNASRFNFGTGADMAIRLVDCSLNMAANAAGGDMTIGQAGAAATRDSLLEWINTDLSFAHAGQSIDVVCDLTWEGGALGGTAPTNIFTPGSGNINGVVNVNGVDLSNTTNNLVLGGQSNTSAYFNFDNCKLGSGVAVLSSAPTSPSSTRARLINSDSGDTNYRYHYQNHFGTITSESTIVLTGGASDGTTTVSEKMVSGSDTAFFRPLVSEPKTKFNNSTSAITLTVEVITDNVTLTDAEAWLEVEYLGTSGFPISSFVSDRAATILTTPANQTSSSVTWTTTGLTTPVKQKLAVTFTPAEKGWIIWRVHLAKASTTMYVDGKATLS